MALVMAGLGWTVGATDRLALVRFRVYRVEPGTTNSVPRRPGWLQEESVFDCGQGAA